MIPTALVVRDNYQSENVYVDDSLLAADTFELLHGVTLAWLLACTALILYSLYTAFRTPR